jgi:hypothetical protein
MATTNTTRTISSEREAPERIRLLIREGQFDGRWYFTDAAVSKYDTETGLVMDRLLGHCASKCSFRC